MSLPLMQDDRSTTIAGSSAGSSSGSPRSLTSSRSFLGWTSRLKTQETSVPSSPTQVDGQLPAQVEDQLPIRSGSSAPTVSDDPLRGWTRLAKEMAKTSEFESFCRFQELNVKNLLYYQEEIAMLQKQLKKIEREDKEGGRVRQKYDRSAEEMFAYYRKNQGKDPRDPRDLKENEQCRLVLEIRELLRQYNAALIQHAEVSRLPRPGRENVKTLRAKLSDASGIYITGSGENSWGEFGSDTDKREPLIRQFLSVLKNLFVWQSQTSSKSDLDLVTVHQPPELDKFTYWVAQYWIPFWHRIRYSKVVEYTETKEYSQSKMLKFTSFVATIVACLLPTASIAILATAKTTPQRLGYIAGFTALFAIMLMWLTDAKSRVPIFTATSAFSAVLVVFVQNQ